MCDERHALQTSTEYHQRNLQSSPNKLIEASQPKINQSNSFK